MIHEEVFKLSELVQAIENDIITISQPLDIEQLCAFWDWIWQMHWLPTVQKRNS